MPVKAPVRERGVILFVLLVLLVSMTLLAVSSGYMVVISERSARAWRDSSMAFVIAETTLRQIQNQELDKIARSDLDACDDFKDQFVPKVTGTCLENNEKSYLASRISDFDAVMASASNSGWASSPSAWVPPSVESATQGAPRYFVEKVRIREPSLLGAGSPLDGSVSSNPDSSNVYQYRATLRAFGPTRLSGLAAMQTLEATFQ
ncbi:MAG: PilX N-terminal domain-containing pilus assembly protein [Craterilacuibacter sp.]